MDSLLSMGISLALSALNEAIKNKKKRATMRAAMLKLAANINIVFADDPQWTDDLEQKTKTEGAKVQRTA